MKKTAFGIMLLVALVVALVLITGVSALTSHPEPTTEQWIPYVPSSSLVDLKFWMINQSAYINVTITFSTPCFNVSDWGKVKKDGYNLSVDSEIWQWTGACVQVICSISYTYDLEYLEEGHYTFSFMVWGIPVKKISFSVRSTLGDVNGDRRVDWKDIYQLILHFMCKEGQPWYVANYDINSDSIVDMKDIYIAILHFMEKL